MLDGMNIGCPPLTQPELDTLGKIKSSLPAPGELILSAQ